MAAAKKPTSQQIAQGKARAGGNNPIKVTDAGLKKLGKVAVTAATMLPAGRAVKAASVIAKAGSEGRAIARGLKAANKPTKASKTTIGNNNKVAVEVRRGMLKNSPPLREGRVRGGGMATLKKQEAEKKILDSLKAKNTALANSAKGKTQTPTAEAARRRNINR